MSVRRLSSFQHSTPPGHVSISCADFSLLHLRDSAIRAEIDRTIELFNDANRIRNEFMHAMYLVNDQGEITHTQMLRFVGEEGGLRSAIANRSTQSADKLSSMSTTGLRQLNRQLWDLLPRLQAAMASTPPS